MNALEKSGLVCTGQGKQREDGKMRIDVAPGLFIDSREIEISFIQASGPGGQNVNKLATAAQLRFDARLSPSLPNVVKARLQGLAGSRLTREGIVVITARRFRSQERNRQDALDRLFELIREAGKQPMKRRPTRPSLAERRRRLEAKGRRSSLKRTRNLRTGD
jgi:ribosome-associated protein